MKIAYINIACGFQPDSTQKKVTKQIESLGRNNNEVTGIFFSTETKSITALSSNISLYPVPKSQGLFDNYKQKVIYFKAISQYIESNIANFDLFYFRYQGSHPIIYKLIKNFGSKICIEFISNNIDDIFEYKRNNPFKFNASSILSHFQFYYLPLFFEKKYAPKIRNTHQCFVTVSETYYLFWKNNTGKGAIISNGYDTYEIEPKKYVPHTNEIKFLILIGTSYEAKSNGVERLLKSFESYMGSYQLKLVIGGNVFDETIKNNRFVEYVGYLNDKEIEEQVQLCDIGVAPLCTYLKEMYTAAPLRTRAYFTFGIPVLNSVIDTDAEKYPSLKKYLIQVENSDSIIDIEQVLNQFFEISKDENYPNAMNTLAQKYLSWDTKMSELTIFLKTFINTKK